MRQITMPDGKILVGEHITGASVSGKVVTVARKNDGGAPYTFTADTAGNASAIKSQVNDIVLGVRGKISVIDPALLAAVITSIEPVAFNITTDTLLIHGYQFRRETTGVMHFEDSGGGKDSNGYFMVCEFLDMNTLKATPGGPGDGALGPGAAVIYYQSTDDKQSNVINGTADASQNITIP